MGVGVLQPWHIILVLVIVLVVFGPGKLPMLGKAVGDTVRDFKKAIGDETAKVDEPAASPRTCPNCHKPMAAADRFCGNCGARTEIAA